MKPTIPKIMLGIPTMGSVHTVLLFLILQWMEEAVKNQEYYLSIMPTINEQPVDNARNHIVEEFIKSDATHLLFIDSDTLPPLNVIKRLLEHNRPIISGITPIIQQDSKTMEYYREWNAVGMDDKHVEPNTGVQQCKGIGASCIMIRKDVFEKMKPPYFRFQYSDDTGKNVVVSEDIYFIINALSLGIPAFVDTSIICKHEKKVLW
jgi:hypothetical protein